MNCFSGGGTGLPVATGLKISDNFKQSLYLLNKASFLIVNIFWPWEAKRRIYLTVEKKINVRLKENELQAQITAATKNTNVTVNKWSLETCFIYFDQLANQLMEKKPNQKCCWRLKKKKRAGHQRTVDSQRKFVLWNLKQMWSEYVFLCVCAVPQLPGTVSIPGGTGSLASHKPQKQNWVWTSTHTDRETS